MTTSCHLINPSTNLTTAHSQSDHVVSSYILIILASVICFEQYLMLSPLCIYNIIL